MIVSNQLPACDSRLCCGMKFFRVCAKRESTYPVRCFCIPFWSLYIHSSVSLVWHAHRDSINITTAKSRVDYHSYNHTFITGREILTVVASHVFILHTFKHEPFQSLSAKTMSLQHSYTVVSITRRLPLCTE